MLKIDIYLKSISENPEDEYVCRNLSLLIPQWQQYPTVIIFVFFCSKYPLNGRDLIAENREKDRLLSLSYQWGDNFRDQCQQYGLLVELICAKSGVPKYSLRGEKTFDIQALIARHLPMFQVNPDGCGITHPQWGKSVYPFVLFSSGDFQIIQGITESLLSEKTGKMPIF